MSEEALHRGLVIAFFVLSPIVLAVLVLVTAPYGRHRRTGWGPEVHGTVGWILMELPSAAVFAACFFVASPERRADPASLVFFALWELHYLHRSLVFPLRRRGGARPMPLLVMGSGVLFNVGNGYLNGRWLFTLGPAPGGAAWLADPRFLVGVALFAVGFVVNYQSDAILFGLRRGGDDTGYRVPRGGLYRFVSCPNYFGELVEWSGWAIATWSLPGLAFAVWTAANLAPRAIAHHRWYRERFADYPRERRALVPFLLGLPLLVAVGGAGCAPRAGTTEVRQLPPLAEGGAIAVAGPRCAGGVCKCRDADDVRPGVEGEEDPIADGRKRFEVRTGHGVDPLRVSVEGRGTLVRSTEEATPACAYLDLPPGRHRVRLQARAADPARGMGPAFGVSEYGARTRSWYRTFRFQCGDLGRPCTRDELGDWLRDARATPRGIFDRCGSVAVEGVRWTSEKAAEGPLEDVDLELTLHVYKFEPRFRPGAPTCKGVGGEEREVAE